MGRFYSAKLKSKFFVGTAAILLFGLILGKWQPQHPPAATLAKPPSAEVQVVSADSPLTQNSIPNFRQNLPPQPGINDPQKLPPAASCTDADAFAQSTNFAMQGAILAQNARSKAEWDEVARQWVQAVAWMQAVPIHSAKRPFAEKKVGEYMRNLAYSQQQAAVAFSGRTVASFSSDILDQQLELYLSYLATVGTPDVMIMGSSRALQGVDPTQLIYALSASGNAGIKIFNFGVNGATAQVVDFILRHLLTLEQLPRMILWADGVRAFNSGRVDRTYDAIITSEGSRLLARGIRPQLPPTEYSGAAACYRFPQTCHAMGVSLEAVQQVRDQPPAMVEVTDYPLQAANPSLVIHQGNSGQTHQNLIVQAGFNEAANAIDANGFLALSMQYNPAIYYQQRPFVPGEYDGDYANFSLEGKQAIALNSVLEFTKNRGIPLVFVNLPLTRDYLDLARKAAERQFQNQMSRLAETQGFIFRDLSQKWLDRNDFFVDPSHLNRYGAQAVSRLLASTPEIPWPHSRNVKK